MEKTKLKQNCDLLKNLVDTDIQTEGNITLKSLNSIREQIYALAVDVDVDIDDESISVNHSKEQVETMKKFMQVGLTDKLASSFDDCKNSEEILLKYLNILSDMLADNNYNDKKPVQDVIDEMVKEISNK